MGDKSLVDRVEALEAAMERLEQKFNDLLHHLSDGGPEASARATD